MTMLGAVGLYVMLGRSTVPRSKALQEHEHRTSGLQPGTASLQPESLRCLPALSRKLWILPFSSFGVNLPKISGLHTRFCCTSGD